MGLDDIGVHVVHGGGNGNGRALLNEVARLLEKLLQTGEGGSIDLAGMPLSGEDYDLLDDVLGEGEVHAEVTALGATEVIEAGVPGVWWITHYNAAEEVMAEFIEVAFCPEILQSPPEDVKEGLEALRARLLEEHLSG
jgi:hydrogenase-1 operon protein HyaF